MISHRALLRDLHCPAPGPCRKAPRKPPNRTMGHSPKTQPPPMRLQSRPCTRHAPANHIPAPDPSCCALSRPLRAAVSLHTAQHPLNHVANDSHQCPGSATQHPLGHFRPAGPAASHSSTPCVLPRRLSCESENPNRCMQESASLPRSLRAALLVTCAQQATTRSVDVRQSRIIGFFPKYLQGEEGCPRALPVPHLPTLSPPLHLQSSLDWEPSFPARIAPAVSSKVEAGPTSAT